MKNKSEIPQESYGIREAEKVDSTVEAAVEQIRRLGYAIVESGYSSPELDLLSSAFDMVRDEYLCEFGVDYLRTLGEHNTIRAMLTRSGSATFWRLAFNSEVLAVVNSLIHGTFILNQQNGIINPPKSSYNQGAWHRDLPYQHFVTTRPLALNALFCIDDFTTDNGSTFVLPASHLKESFPSPNFVSGNAIQVEAQRGSFIVLDCMLYHSGGSNRSEHDRRAVNHVYTIPYLKQQIALPGNVNTEGISEIERQILGCSYVEPHSIREYLQNRDRKTT